MDPQHTNAGNPPQSGPGRSSHALRGDYSAIQPDYAVQQPFEHYTDVEHDRWRRLYGRQMELMPRYAVGVADICLMPQLYNTRRYNYPLDAYRPIPRS